jgi:hypothetical protein
MPQWFASVVLCRSAPQPATAARCQLRCCCCCCCGCCCCCCCGGGGGGGGVPAKLGAPCVCDVACKLQPIPRSFAESGLCCWWAAHALCSCMTDDRSATATERIRCRTTDNSICLWHTARLLRLQRRVIARYCLPRNPAFWRRLNAFFLHAPVLGTRGLSGRTTRPTPRRLPGRLDPRPNRCPAPSRGA